MNILSSIFVGVQLVRVYVRCASLTITTGSGEWEGKYYKRPFEIYKNDNDEYHKKCGINKQLECPEGGRSVFGRVRGEVDVWWRVLKYRYFTLDGNNDWAVGVRSMWLPIL